MALLLGISGYDVFLAALGVSAVIMWWRFAVMRNEAALARWRRGVLLSGLIADSISLALFLAINIHATYIANHGVERIDLIHTYRVALFFVISLVAVICGAFGRSIPRILVMLNGVALAFLWYVYVAASA